MVMARPARRALRPSFPTEALALPPAGLRASCRAGPRDRARRTAAAACLIPWSMAHARATLRLLRRSVGPFSATKLCFQATRLMFQLCTIGYHQMCALAGLRSWTCFMCVGLGALLPPRLSPSCLVAFASTCFGSSCAGCFEESLQNVPTRVDVHFVPRVRAGRIAAAFVGLDRRAVCEHMMRVVRSVRMR